jgi:hypothetical protein
MFVNELLISAKADLPMAEKILTPINKIRGFTAYQLCVKSFKL